jgi:hypothetical protein
MSLKRPWSDVRGRSHVRGALPHDRDENFSNLRETFAANRYYEFAGFRFDG